MKSGYLKWLLGGVALLLVGGLAVSETVNQEHMHRHGKFGGPMFGFWMRQLDLTSDQRAQVKQIMEKEKATLRPLMRQMAQDHLQLAQLELNGTVPDAQIQAMAAQQAQMASQLVVQEARIESELVQVLTPDQKTKLGQLLTERQQHMMNHAQGESQTPNQ